MRIEKVIVDTNGVLYLPVTKDLATHLELEKGTPVIIEDKDGKFGKYAAFWKKPLETKE